MKLMNRTEKNGMSKISPDQLVALVLADDPCEVCHVKLGIYENIDAYGENGSGPYFLCRGCAREATGDEDFGSYGSRHQMVHQEPIVVNVGSADDIGDALAAIISAINSSTSGE